METTKQPKKNQRIETTFLILQELIMSSLQRNVITIRWEKYSLLFKIKLSFEYKYNNNKHIYITIKCLI